MIGAFYHLAGQGLVLGEQTIAVLGLLTVLGAGLVWLLFPPAAKVRWPIFAPLTGLAAVTIVGVPLALLGVPVAHFAPVIAMAGLMISLTVALRMSKNLRGRRILLTWIRHRGRAAAGVLMVVITVSTAFVTWAEGSDVNDVWGSGDFGAYWIVADYMQQYAANLDAYQAQTTFRASDIVDHLTKHARLGCMAYLAFSGALLWPTAIHNAITPSIVALMLLMLGLAQSWLDAEYPHPRRVLLILLFHPFLYFLLYFSYASQASGVALFMAGLLIGGSRKARSIEKVICGCLFGAAVLHYSTMLVAAGVFWAMQIGARLRTGELRPVLLGLLTTLIVAGVYGPHTLNELIIAARAAVLPGWDWRGLIGSLEFIGLRSVLGYEMPEARNMALRFADYAGAIALSALLYTGVRLCRKRDVALTILVTTALLSGVAVLKYLQQIPHATHAVVKTLSTFAIFLCLTASIPVARWCARPPATVRLFSGGVVVFLIVAGQAFTLIRSAPQAPWFGSDLIQLTRRLLNRSQDITVRFAITNPNERKWFKENRATSGPSFEGLPNMHWEMAAPVVRDEQRLERNDDAPQLHSFTILSAREIPPPNDVNLIADREGDYYALPTPQPIARGQADRIGDL